MPFIKVIEPASASGRLAKIYPRVSTEGEKLGLSPDDGESWEHF